MGCFKLTESSKSAKGKCVCLGLSSCRLHGIQSHNSQLESFSQRGGRGWCREGSDPQKPHCAPEPRAALHTRLWGWRHHSKQNKGFNLLLPPRGLGLCCETSPWTAVQSRREEAPAEVGMLQSHHGGCRNRGELPGRGQRGAKHSRAFLSGLAHDPGHRDGLMDCLQTDIQVPTPMCPQGHPRGDPAACGWMHGLGLLSPKGKRSRGPKDSPTSCGESDRQPKLQRESRNSEEIQKQLESNEGVVVWSHLAGHPEMCCCCCC